MKANTRNEKTKKNTFQMNPVARTRLLMSSTIVLGTQLRLYLERHRFSVVDIPKRDHFQQAKHAKTLSQPQS